MTDHEHADVYQGKAKNTKTGILRTNESRTWHMAFKQTNLLFWTHDLVSAQYRCVIRC